MVKNIHGRFAYIAIFLFIVTSLSPAQGQEIEIKGVIFDISQKTALESVTVMATNGRGTMTDAYGRYSIWVREADSVYFSYQNKETVRYPVMKMEDPRQFNMALHVQVFSLPNVIVRPPNYRLDSLGNRQDYAKYFNFNRPNPLRSINSGSSTPGVPGAVGMDPNVIINMFRFKRTRQLASLQRRLLSEEEDKYIDFRFNRRFVRDLTGLDGDALGAFMRKYRPPYDFVAITNTLELGYYIQQCYKRDKGLLPPGVPLYELGPDFGESWK